MNYALLKDTASMYFFTAFWALVFSQQYGNIH